MVKGSRSEVHAYVHILEDLKKKQHLKENIFTQQEFKTLPSLFHELGDKTPENIVRINDQQYYIIEAKNTKEKIDIAIKEAREYADLVNNSNQVKCLFISGIAGNDKEKFVVESEYFHNDKWHTISENNVPITSILSTIQISNILHAKSPNIEDMKISNKEFLLIAEEINEIMHYGGINKDSRAKTISSILLAFAEGSEIHLDVQPIELISSINTKVELVLRKHNKSDFSRFVKIDPPSSTDNHTKFKNALVSTIEQLLLLNIKSAMNSGNDVLGQFYEVFLKYGNGAKEIGIVLTPRHITQYIADVLDININDTIFDPTCGTGGFLVSAYDKVRKNSSGIKFEKFKRHGLYGIEQQDAVGVHSPKLGKFQHCFDTFQARPIFGQ